MITEDHKLSGQSTRHSNNESIYVHSLKVIKITLLERSLNITRLMQITLSHTSVSSLNPYVCGCYGNY